MVRESALRPTISGSAPGLGARPVSSVSFKPFALETLDDQRSLHFGRRFVDGLHSENRCDTLDDAARCRGYRPARSRIAVALFVGMRVVPHRQDEGFRVVDWGEPQ